MKLSKRIQFLLNNIEDCCATYFDIGCDHGKIGLELLKRNTTSKVVFCDISLKNLNKAKELCNLNFIDNKRALFINCDGIPNMSEIIDLQKNASNINEIDNTNSTNINLLNNDDVSNNNATNNINISNHKNQINNMQATNDTNNNIAVNIINDNAINIANDNATYNKGDNKNLTNCIALIFGLGGETISQILKNNKNESIKEFYLQPATSTIKLREYLNGNNFRIIKDYVFKCGELYYDFIHIVASTTKEYLSKEQIMFGKDNLGRKDEEYINYLKIEYDNLSKVLAKIDNSMLQYNVVADKIAKYKEKILLIKNQLKGE
ncbi:MAG: tRNA (adenine(22)-N(1))-methyltransferase TrmK [Christensenellales bacterium]